ncbi:MAG: hypothetical protein COA94_08890 [Rickettsiales bacterium]|nr:MAG: hypothetical protein COA94_08890 [Rickettsiales bacterium]
MCDTDPPKELSQTNATLLEDSLNCQLSSQVATHNEEQWKIDSTILSEFAVQSILDKDRGSAIQSRIFGD